jgi:hypothetical protein
MFFAVFAPLREIVFSPRRKGAKKGNADRFLWISLN